MDSSIELPEGHSALPGGRALIVDKIVPILDFVTALLTAFAAFPTSFAAVFTAFDVDDAALPRSVLDIFYNFIRLFNENVSKNA